MNIGIVGRKRGMTRVFTETGAVVPVTVVEAEPNRVIQVKTLAKDGYTAVQVTLGSIRQSLLTKPEAGHFAKAKAGSGRGLYELRVPEAEIGEYAQGAELRVERFAAGEMVDVTGTTRGKGFAGTIKRWNFTMGDATHGNSLSHRSPGSIGQRQTPGRVFKGKKMAGHMGSERQTTQNLEVVRVDAERNLLLIRGAVPGAPGGTVFVRRAAKG